MRRLLLLTALAALVLRASAASAVGTPDVDLSPVPAVSHGKPVTAFHLDLPSYGQRSAEYLLRSTSRDPQTVRVYATTAFRSATGTFTLSTDRSSPYVELPSYTVTLKPGQRRSGTFRVALHGRPLPTSEQYAAVVLEVRQGSIVQRVATIVYLTPVHVLHLSRTVVGAAVALIVLLCLALLVVWRRRRRPATG